QWTFNDADGDAQGAYQVQIATNSAMTSPVVDTGYVTDGAQEYVLSGYSLVDGTTYYWRVRAKDETGVESDWSDVQQFGRDGEGTLTITAPGANTEDVTPVITHTFTGETQTAVQ